MRNTSKNQPDDGLPGAGAEQEDIEQSFRDSVRRHVLWMEEAIAARLKQSGSFSYQEFCTIRIASMRRIAALGKIIIARLGKAANDGRTDF